MSARELPLLDIADDVRAAAQHGSWCPKMCTFACPVAEATGRDDAVPWSFHRVVDDLAKSRMSADVAATNLRACTGCHACQDACTHEQDVPAQVRAGRAAIGKPNEDVVAALDVVKAGGRFDITIDPTTYPPDSSTLIHVGCHDDDVLLGAAVSLITAVDGQPPTVIADGCCGQFATDVGDPDLAAQRRDILSAHVQGSPRSGVTLIGLDPHCLDILRDVATDGDHVTDLFTYLAARRDRLQWSGPEEAVTYHDPCLLARVEKAVEAPRQLLADAGIQVVEPEYHGATTSCSGAGMGMPLVDSGAAAATAAQRNGQLTATAVPAVTACARARHHLSTDTAEVTALALLLASRLQDSA